MATIGNRVHGPSGLQGDCIIQVSPPIWTTQYRVQTVEAVFQRCESIWNKFCRHWLSELCDVHTGQANEIAWVFGCDLNCKYPVKQRVYLELPTAKKTG